MAEYIDKECIESEELKHYRNSLNSHDAEMFVEFMSWIDDMHPADVVERSEYEELRLVNLDLAETNKGLLAEHGQLLKLRSKIDKAIDEIKGVSFKHHFELGQYIGEETVTWEVVKLDHVLDILRRNIGE